MQFRPGFHVHIVKHREKFPRTGGTPLDPPVREEQLLPSPHPLHLRAYGGEKGSTMPHKLLCCILDQFACKYGQTRERENLYSPAMGVGQWTSLLLSHEFMTTPSKLDCALPTLHPKHSNTRGAIIRIRDTGCVRVQCSIRVRVSVRVTIRGIGNVNNKTKYTLSNAGTHAGELGLGLGWGQGIGSLSNAGMALSISSDTSRSQEVPIKDVTITLTLTPTSSPTLTLTLTLA